MNSDLVFWDGEIVPEGISVFQICLGIPLLSVDESRELGWVSNEEDGGIIVHPVQVPLLGIEFSGEASGVSCGICTSLFSPYGGEPS